MVERVYWLAALLAGNNIGAGSLACLPIPPRPRQNLKLLIKGRCGCGQVLFRLYLLFLLRLERRTPFLRITVTGGLHDSLYYTLFCDVSFLSGC